MVPTLEPGDEIVVQHADFDEIRRGDLVTFKVGPEVVTHRVIKRIEKDGSLLFLQKGDNGPRTLPLPAECAIGKVIEIRLRSGKHVISLVTRFARSAAYVVAQLELLFAGPIQYFSKRLKDKSGCRKHVALFFYRVFLRLRDKTIRLVLRAVRLLCRTSVKSQQQPG